jgi:hypothetical protein
VQVAIALVLVFGASIAGRAFLALVRQPLGFVPDNVLTVSVVPQGLRGTAMQDAYIRLIESVSQEPGVVAVGASASIPRVRGNAWAGITRPGTQEVAAAQILALPGYFDAARIAVVAGRPYSTDEVRSGARVAVVSGRAAQALFGGRDPLGASFNDSDGNPFTVVGVVADVEQHASRESEPLVYTAPGVIGRQMVLFVRLQHRNATVADAVRRRIAAEAPGTVVTASWWTDRINALAAYRNPRFQSMALGAFAAIALALTALGVFGVVSVMVAARTKEIGIRLALGSTPRHVVRHSMLRSLTPVAIGIAAGLLATRWLARLAEAQLYQIDTRDPMMLALTGVVVLGAGLTAAWLPSRRAGRVDPVIALRSD